MEVQTTDRVLKTRVAWLSSNQCFVSGYDILGVIYLKLVSRGDIQTLLKKKKICTQSAKNMNPECQNDSHGISIPHERS